MQKKLQQILHSNMEKRWYVFDFSGLRICKILPEEESSSVFSVTLYTKDLLTVNFCSSAWVCVGFSACPKEAVRAISAPFTILTFPFRNNICNFFNWVYKVLQPKTMLLCVCFVMDLWNPHKDLKIVFLMIHHSLSASLYELVCALELDCLSHMWSWLNALLINYIITISGLV